MRRKARTRRLALLAVVGALALAQAAQAQTPEVLDPELAVRVAASGLSQPTGMAFIGENDILVNQKANGQVRRVTNGVLQPDPVLDLAVNFQSERGLLGMALDKRFRVNGWVYLYWTQSSTGVDTNVNDEVPLLGNRVDRFVWNGSTLTFDRNVIMLRAAQPAVPATPGPAQNAAGNHDGGVLRVSPDDGKLYIFIGDVGRRGWTNNLRCGPATFYDCPPSSPLTDDIFGGPMPDDAHLTGVVLRLNPDGTAPRWNPFFRYGAEVGGEVGENIQKIYAYGFRNGYGMAFDPVGHRLWEAANGDDTFSELELVEAGMNSGWIQIMGPVSRVAQFKTIETTMGPTTDPFAPNGYFGLQQNRWLPTNIADTPAEALSRLQLFPGAHYSDPELSWVYEVGPAAIGFLDGKGLGNEYKNDLFMGGSRNFLEGGHLFRFDLTGNRKGIDVSDPRLEDLVADNLHKWNIVESESLLFGRNFGIVTEILTGPNGNLFLLSNQAGAIYEIYRP
ncbi:MAG TPA: PQQ-dependent sugar dehydrogenase [Gaiellaceae bacterium]|nr:PQQ-dependent sugar dehydrogenase [Gaiellaceae bacterium]